VSCAAASDGSGTDLVVGIDAGGTGTRARAVWHGQVMHEGASGPGNPLAVDPAAMRASYYAALAGCPPAGYVAACVAGAGSKEQQAHITSLLAERFPGAQVRVVPDFVAALLAAPPGTDVCVIAGTGSVICSAADGGFAVSGGRGWILGDHGSAARLGRAALERFVADPAAAPGLFTGAVKGIFGDEDWRAVVSAVSRAPSPARLLARAAPLLTTAAEQGERWAGDRLDEEMASLAVTTVRHIEEHVRTPAPSLALSGGVWASPAAQSAFTAAVRRLSTSPLTVTRSVRDPIEGAVRLAQSMSCEHRTSAH
jgi:N-acetylglucosamine kinase-like BadF-type ATPase